MYHFKAFNSWSTSCLSTTAVWRLLLVKVTEHLCAEISSFVKFHQGKGGNCNGHSFHEKCDRCMVLEDSCQDNSGSNLFLLMNCVIRSPGYFLELKICQSVKFIKSHFMFLKVNLNLCAHNVQIVGCSFIQDLYPYTKLLILKKSLIRTSNHFVAVWYQMVNGYSLMKRRARLLSGARPNQLQKSTTNTIACTHFYLPQEVLFPLHVSYAQACTASKHVASFLKTTLPCFKSFSKWLCLLIPLE